jgi:hypothetical protein
MSGARVLPQEPWMALIRAMGAEIKAITELKGLETQVHRRLLVRVIFSTFEGYAFHLRQRAIAIGEAKKFPFSKTSMEKLTEEEQRRREDGTVEKRKRFMKSIEGLRFSIDTLARVLDIPGPESPTGHDLEVGFAVRDRLTHPKAAADFEITEAEAQAMGRVGEWFAKVVTWYSATEVKYIEDLRDSISRSVEEQKARMKRDLDAAMGKSGHGDETQ